jgi:hypothetical protein
MRTRTAPWDYRRRSELAERMEERDIQVDAIRFGLGDAMAKLRQLDPKGWEAWYDDDNNVPAIATMAELLDIVQARCETLRAEIDQTVSDLYWETGDPLDLAETDEFEVRRNRRWLNEESAYDTRLLVGV